MVVMNLDASNTVKLCFRPFSVTPTSGTLDVFESMQVTVTFNPMTVGDHSQGLILHYNTGEKNRKNFVFQFLSCSFNF